VHSQCGDACRLCSDIGKGACTSLTMYCIAAEVLLVAGLCPSADAGPE
jgi:hypothetical protein